MSLLHLLSLEFLRLFLGLDFDLVGSVGLLFDLFVQSLGHELNFLSKHVQSLFRMSRLLSQELVSVR